ncbi:hypothetical protein [Stutzerimonas kunmingensis]|uniref:hypothetical protein n=1 Tax=Stutzerimonas kunmingensis TaxID=1211807 RepID=UPI00241BFFA7|nr:hypothetical protein [Stutzerimonas kunmingensis]
MAMEWMLALFEKYPGTASWAQALGSLLALGIAIWTVTAQNREQRRQIKEQNKQAVRQKMDSFNGVVDFAIKEFEQSLDGLAKDHDRDMYIHLVYNRSTFDGILRVLDAFPIHELPNYETTGSALRIRDACNIACGAIQTAIAAVASSNQFEFEFSLDLLRDTAGYIRGQHAVFQRTFNEYIATTQ